MHGNMSGPLIVEGIFNKERMVGPEGDSQRVRMIAYSILTFTLPVVNSRFDEVCSVQ